MSLEPEALVSSSRRDPVTESPRDSRPSHREETWNVTSYISSIR